MRLLLAALAATSFPNLTYAAPSIDRIPDAQNEVIVPADTRLRFGSITFYAENDKFFAGTDRNYTNGFKLSALSTSLRDFDQDGVPGPVRAIARSLRPLMRDDATPKLGLSLGQNIYTPEDTATTAYQPADRPYAAWLYLGINYQNYYPPAPGSALARLGTIEVQLGAAGGDWALGEFVQNNFHKLISVEQSEGWGNQLDSEPGLNLVYEHKWRFSTAEARTGWGADFIPHAGFSLGNVFTYANAGTSARFGYRLPSDFGTNLIRPTGDSNPGERESFGIWLFGSVDARTVARDLTLDGNTFQSGGPSLDKETLVADLIGGLGLGTRHWQLTYAQAVRTKEFKGQSGTQVFGSLSLTYFY